MNKIIVLSVLLAWLIAGCYIEPSPEKAFYQQQYTFSNSTGDTLLVDSNADGITASFNGTVYFFERSVGPNVIILSHRSPEEERSITLSLLDSSTEYQAIGFFRFSAEGVVFDDGRTQSPLKPGEQFQGYNTRFRYLE